MDYLTKSPLATRINSLNNHYRSYIAQSPYLCSKLDLNKNYILNNSCKCDCSCHRHRSKFNRESSYNNLTSFKLNNYNYKTEINKNINSNEGNKNIIRAKSMYNLSQDLYNNNNYKNYYFKDFKKNYTTHYNYNNYNKYDFTAKKNINTENYNTDIKFIKDNNSIKKSYDNHTFVDVKDQNKEDENSSKKLYKVKLQRKKLAKFYHNIKLKKYPYGLGNIQTTNKTNNHKYTEIYGSSKNNENNYLQKSLVINYAKNIPNSNNKNVENNIDYEYIQENKENRNSININNDNDNNIISTNIINNNNTKNNNNHKYSYSQYSSRNKKISINKDEPKDSEVESKIIKETHNTRLVEVKSPNKDKNIIYKTNSDLNYDNKKSLFNNYTYYKKFENNNISNNTNNNINFKYNYSNQRKNTSFKSINHNNNNNENTNNNNYNYNNNRDKFIKYNYAPYKSSENLNYEINNRNINNKNYMKNKFSILKNNHINNLNYNLLKQKVRLSLLKKEIYEHKRERNQKDLNNDEDININNSKYNNRIYQNSSNKFDNNLYDKETKFMEDKRPEHEIINNYQEEYENDIYNNSNGQY